MPLFQSLSLCLLLQRTPQLATDGGLKRSASGMITLSENLLHDAWVVAVIVALFSDDLLAVVVPAEG